MTLPIKPFEYILQALNKLPKSKPQKKTYNQIIKPNPTPKPNLKSQNFSPISTTQT